MSKIHARVSNTQGNTWVLLRVVITTRFLRGSLNRRSLLVSAGLEREGAGGDANNDDNSVSYTTMTPPIKTTEIWQSIGLRGKGLGGGAKPQKTVAFFEILY